MVSDASSFGLKGSLDSMRPSRDSQTVLVRIPRGVPRILTRMLSTPGGIGSPTLRPAWEDGGMASNAAHVEEWTPGVGSVSSMCPVGHAAQPIALSEGIRTPGRQWLHHAI